MFKQIIRYSTAISALILSASCVYAQRMYINVSVQSTSAEITGFSQPMVITDPSQTVSSESPASIIQNTGSGLYVDVSPTNGNPGEPLTVSNNQRIVPIKLVCKPCGEDSEPMDMSAAVSAENMIYLDEHKTSTTACKESQASCHFEVPKGSLDPSDDALLGSVTLTLVPQG